MGGKADANYPETEQFVRLRSRKIICTGLGGIFFLIADYCVSEAKRDPLCQVELEYVGYISKNASKAYSDEDRESDFEDLSRFIYSFYERNRSNPAYSQKTKFEWILA